MSGDRSTKDSASAKAESAPRQSLGSSLPTLLSAKEERWRREAIEEAARMGIIKRPSPRDTGWKEQQQLLVRGAVRPNPKPGSKPRKPSRVIIPQRSRKMIMSALSVPRYYKSRTASNIKSLKRMLERRKISSRKVKRKKIKSAKKRKKLEQQISSSDSLSTSESSVSSSHTSSCSLSSADSSSSLTDGSSSESSSPNRRNPDHQSYHKSRLAFAKVKTGNISSSSGLAEKQTSGSDDKKGIAKNDQPENNISRLKQKQSFTSSSTTRQQPVIESKPEAENVSLKPKEKQTTYIGNKLDGHLLTSIGDGFKRSRAEGKRNMENLKTEPRFAIISSEHSPPTVPITCLRKLPLNNVLQTGRIMSDLGPNKPFPKLI